MPEPVSLPRAAEPPAARSPAPAKAHWFADLALTRHGLTVRKSGRRIGFAEITPGEFLKFCGYLVFVLTKSAWVQIVRPARLSVYFSPDRPRPWYIVWSAMALGGIKYAKSAADANATFYFEDLTVGMLPRGLPPDALNAACTDISKSRVAAVWAEVAGYRLAVDPLRHIGEAVEKSELNGLHDGRIVSCPRVPQPGRAYQAFIDASAGDIAFDLRTTIIGRKPLFVLLKTKPAGNRFSIHNDTVTFAGLEDVYSPGEVDLLTRFAEAMQLDWAALDVLRDRTSGRIYVVDVNKTDTGPAVDLCWADRQKLTQAISRAFTGMVRNADLSDA